MAAWHSKQDKAVPTTQHKWTDSSTPTPLGTTHSQSHISDKGSSALYAAVHWQFKA